LVQWLLSTNPIFSIENTFQCLWNTLDILYQRNEPHECVIGSLPKDDDAHCLTPPAIGWSTSRIAT
jgi:hypothetical protein